MIGKGKSIGHATNGIDYALNRDQAEIIDKRFVVGDNGTEIKNEFKIFQNLNQRCEKNDLSFVLSPEPKNGKALNNSDFKAIADDFLNKMGLGKHQAIVIKHQEKKHTHLHIFTNRIDNNGIAYKDKHIGYKSQNIADQVAQDRNLTRAKEVRDMNIALEKENLKEIKSTIFQKHRVVLEHKPKNFKEYSDLMKSSGVDILPTINKQGDLQGYRLKFQGHNLKATQVHRTMSLSKMGVNQSLSKGMNVASNLNPALKIGFKIAKTITKGISLGY